MLIFYDLETTGLNVFHDKITEICCLKQNDSNYKCDKFTTLINPEAEIPDIVTKITGIDKSMVIDKPNFNQISDQLLFFINNTSKDETIYFVAHNNDGFDKLMLTSHFKRRGIDIKKFNWKFIDTLLLAKKLFPKLKKYNLKSLCEQFNIRVLNAHRAEADTIMMKDLFYCLVNAISSETMIPLDKLLSNQEIIYNYIY